MNRRLPISFFTSIVPCYSSSLYLPMLDGPYTHGGLSDDLQSVEDDFVHDAHSWDHRFIPNESFTDAISHLPPTFSSSAHPQGAMWSQFHQHVDADYQFDANHHWSTNNQPYGATYTHKHVQDSYGAPLPQTHIQHQHLPLQRVHDHNFHPTESHGSSLYHSQQNSVSGSTVPIRVILALSVTAHLQPSTAHRTPPVPCLCFETGDGTIRA